MVFQEVHLALANTSTRDSGKSRSNLKKSSLRAFLEVLQEPAHQDSDSGFLPIQTHQSVGELN